MDYKGFSRGQREYLRRSVDCWLNVAEGGKRAGKNVINVVAFAMALEQSPEKLHLVAGVTKACARMNIIDCNGFGLRHFFGGRCHEGRYEGKDALFVDDKVVIIEGGGKSNDAARIKGASFGSIYISEANEIHKSFFFEALDRTLASRKRKIFLDLNAKPQGHWFYREFLSLQEKLLKEDAGYGLNYGHFTIFNNKAITPEALEEALKSYDKASAWYKRDILGLRSAGAESIYMGFGREMILPIKELSERNYVKMSVGIDVGGRDATVATLAGIDTGGNLALIDGYYHKQGDENYMTHEKYVREIGEKIEGWIRQYPALCFGGAIFCESAEKMFRAALSGELKRRGLNIMVYPSYKKDGILERIRLFCLLIGQGRLVVAGHLSPWIDALYAARWDEKAREKGIWERVDDGSYAVDCLDSAEYATVPFKRQLIINNE
ncbi:MAG: PBSX family phage terminase large subunit [Clostridiales bacterium]|jgi:PBSX family phage terminase large subunit|nr:PBSX family phage terminase large subunit [Clostridiales bacterium]